MDSADNEKRYVIIDENGMALCCVSDKLVKKPISEVKHYDEFFTFWDYKINELKEYINGLNQFNINNPLTEILGYIDSISFLEISHGDKENSFILG